MSYLMVVSEGVVLRAEDGKQVAPCQSANDQDFVDYLIYVEAGNTIFEVASRSDMLPPVPESVSRFQARAALWLKGLIGKVEEYMALETTSMLARIAWNEAQEFRRDSGFVIEMILLLGLTESQGDDLFRFASTIAG